MHSEQGIFFWFKRFTSKKGVPLNVSKWNDEYSTWILYNYLNLGILQTNLMTSSQLPAPSSQLVTSIGQSTALVSQISVRAPASLKFFSGYQSKRKMLLSTCLSDKHYVKFGFLKPTSSCPKSFARFVSQMELVKTIEMAAVWQT